MAESATNKPTVASLAAQLDELETVVQSAVKLTQSSNDAVTVAVGVTESQSADIAQLKNEQVALAKLVNGLGREPGAAVKPDRLDNVLARLEAVERNGTQDWTPLVQAYGEKVDALASAVKNVADGLTAVEDKAGTAPGGAFEDLTRDVEELKKLVDSQSSTASTSQEISALVVNEVNERIERIVRRRATFEQSLLERLEQLENALAVEPMLPGRAPAGHAPAVGNVHAKLLELMREVDHIAKTRNAKGGGMNYKFRGIDDAQNAVGAAMRKIGLLLQPEVISWDYTQMPVEGFDDKGRPKTTVWSTSRLTMMYTFVSPDDGSTFAFSMAGEGRDSGDKSGSKAASMACKYALFQALMVPLEVDESDGENPVVDYGRPDTVPYDRNSPGVQVSRGEISPAQAVQEYQQPKVQVPSGSYNPVMDSSAMAGADTDDTLMQKAAQAAHYLREAQKQPAEVALTAIGKLKARVEALEIGDMTVSWSDGSAPLPLKTMISTALQNANAAIAARAQAAGAQGVTRQAQQAGEGARAAVTEDRPPADWAGSEAQYNAALQVVSSNGSTDAEIDDAMAIIHAWETTH